MKKIIVSSIVAWIIGVFSAVYISISFENQIVRLNNVIDDQKCIIERQDEAIRLLEMSNISYRQFIDKKKANGEIFEVMSLEKDVK